MNVLKKTLLLLPVQSVGYQAQQSSVLTGHEINQFMINTPDKEWFVNKS